MNLHRVLFRSLLVLGVFLLQIHVRTAEGQVRPRVVDAVDDARRTTLSGNVHPLARAEFDRGAVAESQPMNRILLLLKRSDEQETALQDALTKQQDKSSTNFHQWLTPEQFGAQFGPVDADIQAVTDWLTGQGFTIGKVYSGKTVIEFSGTAGQVRRAFGTGIHNYQVNGKLYSANASDPQIPAALGPVVTGVVSLHNFPREFYARRFGNLHRAAGKSVVEPLVTMPNPFGPGSFYGVGPGDFAKIYGVPATCGNPAAACTGSRQTIAIVGETNLRVTDVQQFRSVFGLPATFDANSIVYNGEDPGITSPDEEGEADLDTQWSGGVAPGATIKYVLSASTSASQGVDLSALYIVEHNLAAVMSESYGACESILGSTENSFYNSLWQQASAQGITVAVATGDSGSAGCDNPNTENLATNPPGVNGLASTPYNVAVGGTDFDEYNNWAAFWNTTNDAVTGASAKGYIPEIPWNQSCAQLGATGCNINTTPVPLQNIVAGGGGPSQYNKPSWQMGIAGMPSDGKRDLPDISLLASPGFNGSGYLYCQGDVSRPCLDSSGFSGYITFGVIGGTSVSAPAFAGIMALINQSQATVQNPAPRQGNANYVLYELANKSGTSCASATPVAAGCVFNDISKGSGALPGGGTGIGTISVPCKVGVPGCSATRATQIGVLDDPNNPGTMAWNAGAGYDRATGLGSLNVGNLITNWTTVASVPTSTTLTLSPTTGITHGSESVTTTISVTPKTATGTVSLIAQPSAGQTITAGAFTLGTNGSVSGTTTNLPGGANYAVYAHYSGDGTNAPSDSAAVNVSVAPESSKTFIVVPTFDPTTGNQLNGNATSVNYGSPYIVRVYVTNSAAAASPTGAPTGACTQASKVACPSGTIALTANGSGVDGGTFSLNDIGYTRDIAPTLPGGTYPLAAAYSGDTSYQASNASESFTVNPAASQLAAPTYISPVVVGNPVTFNVLLTTQAFLGVAPTGTVTFYDGSVALTGTTTLNPTAPGSSGPATLFASFTTTITTGGTHAVTAKYSGDTNYAGASSPQINVQALYTTTIIQSESPTPPNINFGQSVTITAIVKSSQKTPALSGQFQFNASATPISGPIAGTPGVDGSGNQTLTASVTTVPDNTEFIQAAYVNDVNFMNAYATSDLIQVNVPDFSLPSSTTLSVAAGHTGATTIDITPLTNTPSPVTLSLQGSPPPGTTLTINPTTANLNGIAVQVQLTFNAGGSAPASITPAIRGGHPRRSVAALLHTTNWWSGPGLACLVILFVLALPKNGKRAPTGTVVAAGLLFACLLGCGGGGGGGGGGGVKAATSIAIATSNPKVPAGTNYTLTATVTATQPLTGTVNFFLQGTGVIGPSIPVVNNTATYVVQNPNSTGIYEFTAQYNGDAKNLSSQTSTGVQEVVTGTANVSVMGQTGFRSHQVSVVLNLQ